MRQRDATSRRSMRRTGIEGLLAAMLVAQPLAAQHAGHDAALGRVDFDAPCAPAVRADFDRAVALLHHMTYPVAHATFASVAEADPDCALAYWGMAVTLFQPLWPTRPSPAELERGWGLAQEAAARSSGDPREQGFIDAAVAFFDPAGGPDYWTRIERWAEAHERLHDAFPEDREVRAFYALSQLATAARRDDTAARHAAAAALLAGILEEEPTHPGAVHYTIHANDFDGRQAESLAVVRGYSDIAPSNPHALHMPTHIFVRLGDWDGVIEWNRKAAEAALAQRVGPADEYVWDEYPHALEYLVYAYLQIADDAAASEALAALRAKNDLQPSFKTAFHLASIPARYALERKDWALAAGLEPRTPATLDWDLFGWPEAVVWHARGMGQARTGRADDAGVSLRRIRELERRASEAGESLFADQIRVLALEVEAWIAAPAGAGDRAVGLMEEAASLEESTPKHPVTPGAAIPAREMLGDLYAELGKASEAIDAYERSDARTPGRLNAALGLARAHASLGEAETAAAYYRRVLERAVQGTERAGVAEARAFLDRRG
jgi:tetratricopeptide (TPR) repeat protein